MIKPSTMASKPASGSGMPPSPAAAEGNIASVSFKDLLIETSTRFIHLPAGQIDAEIEDLLRRICTFLGIHLGSVFQVVGTDSDAWRLTHLYQHPAHRTIVQKSTGELAPRGGWSILEPAEPPYYLEFEAKTFWPWVVAQAAAGETVVLESVDDLPAEASLDARAFRQMGDSAALVFSLVVGDKRLGMLNFAMRGVERRWGKRLVEDLRLLSQVLANAIARKAADLALQRSEERLQLAALSAHAIHWSLDNRTGVLWLNRTGRDLLGYPGEGEVTWERFMLSVVPEDRERLQAALREAASGEEIQLEHRIRMPEGQARWIHSRGTQHFDAAGKPSLVLGISLDVTERKDLEQCAAEQFAEICRLKRQLEEEVVDLRQAVRAQMGSVEILGDSRPMAELRSLVGRLAGLTANVLIRGETGSGKNLVAAAIHAQSPRCGRPMVVVDCAALPGNLVETVLFGRDPGAAGGNGLARPGRFEQADGSTILLDEVCDLSLECQGKLLRVVQTGEFERLGSALTRRVDVRILASTSRDLERMVREGQFRADLFHRLNVLPLAIPALREHREDIPALARALAERFARKYGRTVPALSGRTLEALQEGDWPGNVRELESVVERLVAMPPEGDLRPPEAHREAPAEQGTADAGPAPGAGVGQSLKMVERDYIERTLQSVWWRVEGRGGAAELLGLNPSTLRARMNKLGLRRR